ncbi:hypothetical protein GGF43_007003, partial [Coemansia sp. RSA 2618]
LAHRRARPRLLQQLVRRRAAGCPAPRKVPPRRAGPGLRADAGPRHCHPHAGRRPRRGCGRAAHAQGRRQAPQEKEARQAAQRRRHLRRRPV